jgi:hypothetical protein
MRIPTVLTAYFLGTIHLHCLFDNPFLWTNRQDGISIAFEGVLPSDTHFMHKKRAVKGGMFVVCLDIDCAAVVLFIFRQLGVVHENEASILYRAAMQ